ncbi:hypothetical protein AB6A40_010153 [Gnathostoma spinigerum]|uniref:Uncharacterized protein n=1 Tax=Gnathostoma spinigerum TaxID=75299 RepID=A0ABD6ETZ2_9BILA
MVFFRPSSLLFAQIWTRLILSYPSKIPIKAFTTPEDAEQGITAALYYAERSINRHEHSNFHLDFTNRQLGSSEENTWAIMNNVCDELKEGMMIMMCGYTGRGHEAYTTVSETLEVPLINWDLAPIQPADGLYNK